jgi:nitrous oxidase accessory protein
MTVADYQTALRLGVIGCVLILSAAGYAAAADDPTDWRRAGKVGPLQIEISKLRPGETLHLPPGRSEGPIVIRTPGVTIDGGGQSEIFGGNEGSVVVIAAPDVTVKNVHISGTGIASEQIDAGISIRSTRHARIENTTISNALFGIDVEYSHDVVVKGNRITSKDLELGLRGDAIRIHSSKDIAISDNHWSDSRDAVAWYSEGISFENNVGVRSRYSLHSMYTKRLIITGNRFEYNSVGIFLMYGGGVTLRNNVVRHSVGATGIGIGLKETSGVFAQNNTILYCASGILVDNSPWDPTTRNWFFDNTVAFGRTGVVLSNDREGNEFRGNTFSGNLIDVRAESRNKSPSLWLGNIWDNYEGFDRDGDGVGDTPYVVRNYGDGFNELHPYAGFFFGSPMELLIQAIQRLSPLTEPAVVLEDASPRLYKRPAAVAESTL